MKKLYNLLIILLTIVPVLSQAQCPGCVIDATCGANMNPVAPSLCPAVMPNATQGQYYDQDLTFFMPRTFVDQQSGQTVTLNSITVTQIVGMPQGIAYQCNNTGCQYTVTSNPGTQRGCVKICGTPTVPGNYNIVVSVVANVTTPIGTINNPASFAIGLVVDPAAGGNPYFSFNPPSACGSLNVTYSAFLDFSPNRVTSYAWTFNNGNTSTLKNPPVQSYNTPGTYYPRLVTTVSSFVLTAATFTATGSGWCGDVEEPKIAGVCQGSPDLFFTYTNGNDNYTSTAGNNNLTTSWTNLNRVLTTPVLTLQFFDLDNISANDNLGIVSQNITAPGTFSFSTYVNGAQEGFGNFTIGLRVDTTYTFTDTIRVFANPPVPVISAIPNDSICFGDSILLKAPAGPYQYQWFRSQTFISDSIAVWAAIPGLTGYYNLRVTDTTSFCTNTADSIKVTFVLPPPSPVISLDPGTNSLIITNNNNNLYSVKWFNDGTEITGATSNSLAGQTTSGPYTASFTSSIGCRTTSFPFTLCLAGSVVPIAADTVCCGELKNMISTGFVTSQGHNVAWAVTPTSFGPVNSPATVQSAFNAGKVYIGTTDTTLSYNRLCTNHADSIAAGWYYVTPFIAENAAIAPVTWDTLTADCRPHMEICPLITGDPGWALDPLIFTFPDGSQFNVNDQYIPGIHLVIDQGVIDILPGGTLPCIPLTTLFLGNPNGTWLISATNIGSGAVNVNIPPFQIVTYSDTCTLITQDEVYTFNSMNISLAPGQSQTVQLHVPPIPGSFPSVNPICTGFGSRDSIYVKNCYPDLTCNLTIDSIQGSNVTVPNGSNGFVDMRISGGTPPYQISWSHGSTTEDLFNIPAGTYTISVTDAANCLRTRTIVITASNGLNDLNYKGFTMMQNIPNPFNNQMSIDFASDVAGEYLFSIQSLEGKLLYEQKVTALQGMNKINFQTEDLSSGVYFYSLKNEKGNTTRKMMVAKE